MNLRSAISERLLPFVQTPGQYIGGEVNEQRKAGGDLVSVALAFPDTYAVGMSHLGSAILYEAVNRLPHAVAERVFCPWVDAADVMRREGLPLFSWESRRPVREFDILGITLQHELAYSNILYLLDLAGITWRSVERRDDEPLVLGGGPIADCCEPVADFFDAVILGDGEEALPAFVTAYRELRPLCRCRRTLLHELARRFPWLYVPQLYECSYDADGRLAACAPTVDDIPGVVSRALVGDLDKAVFPTRPLVPFTDAVHNRIAIEIMRGCPGRCAFCHAGHTKGPLRYRSVDNIVEIAWQSYLATGHDTVSLLSLSTSDYPHLAELTGRLHERFEGCHVGISLPSLRVDKQLKDVPGQVSDVRREGLTLAVEAASDHVRRAIGKKVTDDDLLATLEAALRQGWRKVKLYFMVGFPGESDADILGIMDLAGQISRLGKAVHGQPVSVSAAVSWLTPKPHTPFGFMAQQTLPYFQRARWMLLDAKRQARGVNVNFKFHFMERSLLEGALSRGDRRLAAVLEHAYRDGARFDAWNEHFDYERYRAAFAACGLDPAFYAHRERRADEPLPWDHLAGDNRAALHRRWVHIRQQLLAGKEGGDPAPVAGP